MTRSRVERAVARATGESLVTVQRLGFSIVEQQANICDDPPPRPSSIDWEVLQRRRVGIFPARRRTTLAG